MEYALAGALLAAGAGVIVAAFAWGGLSAPGIAPKITDSSPAAVGVVGGVFGPLLLWMVYGLRGVVLGLGAAALGLGIGALIYA